MIFFKKYIIWVFGINLFGCAIISPRIDISDKPNQKIIQNCKSESVIATYTQFLDIAGDGLRNADPDDPNIGGIKWYSYYLHNYLKKNSYVNLLIEPENNPTLYIHFNYATHLTANKVEDIWLKSTIFTLGLIPSVTRANVTLSAEVFDSNHNRIESFKAKPLTYYLLNGLIFLPIELIVWTSKMDLNEKYMPVMAEDIIDQMIQKKLLCNQH